jgi:hypothetical protein
MKHIILGIVFLSSSLLLYSQKSSYEFQDTSNCKTQVFQFYEGLNCPDSVHFVTFLLFNEEDRTFFPGLDSCIFFKNTRVIEITSYGLIDLIIPSNIYLLEKLELLSLNGKISQKTFPKTIDKCKALQSIELSGTYQIDTLPLTIFKIQSLEHIMIMMNRKESKKLINSILLPPNRRTEINKN